LILERILERISTLISSPPERYFTLYKYFIIVLFFLHFIKEQQAERINSDAANINEIAIISSSPAANAPAKIILLSIRVDETARYVNTDATWIKMRLAINVYMKNTPTPSLTNRPPDQRRRFAMSRYYSSLSAFVSKLLSAFLSFCLSSSVEERKIAGTLDG